VVVGFPSQECQRDQAGEQNYGLEPANHVAIK
jgi:hypothetical protein